MSWARYKDILAEGVWRNNVVFAQMLSLCPTMAVTSSATQGFGMGAATTAVMLLSNALVAALRRWITPEVRIPAYVLIIAAMVTVIDLTMNAWMHDLHKVLGLYIPLIVANCLVLGRAEAFASKNGVAESAVDGFAMGGGLTFALTLIGGLRELTGAGTLFAGAHTLLGPAFAWMELRVYPTDGALMMILPPGAFIVVGFLIAAKRALDARSRARAAAAPAAAVAQGAAS